MTKWSRPTSCRGGARKLGGFYAYVTTDHDQMIDSTAVLPLEPTHNARDLG